MHFKVECILDCKYQQSLKQELLPTVLKKIKQKWSYHRNDAPYLTAMSTSSTVYIICPWNMRNWAALMMCASSYAGILNSLSNIQAIYWRTQSPNWQTACFGDNTLCPVLMQATIQKDLEATHGSIPGWSLVPTMHWQSLQLGFLNSFLLRFALLNTKEGSMAFAIISAGPCFSDSGTLAKTQV